MFAVDRDRRVDWPLERIGRLDCRHSRAAPQPYGPRGAVALAHSDDRAGAILRRLARDDEHAFIFGCEQTHALLVRELRPGSLQPADSRSGERRKSVGQEMFAEVRAGIGPRRPAQE